MKLRVRRCMFNPITGAQKGGLMGIVILWPTMKVKIVQYTPSYFGIVLDEKQLRLLRRIACDRGMTVNDLIEYYIQKGFVNTERYIFSEMLR